MLVFPLKSRNSAFWKAFISYETKTSLYGGNSLSLAFGEISTFKSLFWWKAARIKARFRAWEFLSVTTAVKFAGGTSGVIFVQVNHFISISLTHLLKGSSTGYSVHPHEAVRLG